MLAHNRNDVCFLWTKAVWLRSSIGEHCKHFNSPVRLLLRFGDWAGQLAPISDRETIDIWKELPTSDFMHQLVNGLSIQINKYRRGKDYDHFKFVKSIYPTDDKEDLNNALRQARIRYPIAMNGLCESGRSPAKRHLTHPTDALLECPDRHDCRQQRATTKS